MKSHGEGADRISTNDLDTTILKITIRRNKLLGMWAAEKLGITGGDAEAYSDALAMGKLDPEPTNVFSKIRKDFDAAGVVQSDEQILHDMDELMLQAENHMQATEPSMLQLRCLRVITSRGEAGRLLLLPDPRRACFLRADDSCCDFLTASFEGATQS